MTALARTERSQTLEDIEVELLLSGIAQHHGYDFRDYSRATLTRRVRQAMLNESLASISELQALVLHDSKAMRRFIASLSIHVSSMFRDPDFYRALREVAVPILRTYPFIRIWHAGCATGEEVYSTAILLEEEGLYERARIYATDMSEVVLESARRGVFPLQGIQDSLKNYQRSGGHRDFADYHVSDSEHVMFRERLRRNLVFSQHNLTWDQAFNEFHLILCRNVMIYFNRVLRERVSCLLYQSLVRFGLLGLGKKESVAFTSVGDQYQELVPDVRLYRRIQ